MLKGVDGSQELVSVEYKSSSCNFGLVINYQPVFLACTGSPFKKEADTWLLVVHCLPLSGPQDNRGKTFSEGNPGL